MQKNNISAPSADHYRSETETNFSLVKISQHGKEFLKQIFKS